MEKIFEFLELARPKIIEMDFENVKNIKLENIPAFTFAYPGAMGEEGQLTVLDLKEDLNFYHINRYVGDEKLVKIVDSTFFKPFADLLNDDVRIFLPEIEGWDRVSLGYGNLIFIRKEYLNNFAKFTHAVYFNLIHYPVSMYKYNEQLLNAFFNPKYEKEKAEIMTRSPSLLGAIIGDIAGSRFEFKPHRDKDFELLYSFSGLGYTENQTVEDLFKSSHFTDDTVMTIAVANALIEANWNFENLSEIVVKNLKDFGKRYPYRGYGFNFQQWLIRDTVEPYNSLGNGSAMRISAVPYFAKDLDEVKKLSKIVSEVTHNHPEGIKGAEAVAVAIWMALHNYSKEDILSEMEQNYYKLNFDYEELRQTYKFDETCPGSVPQSIFAFMISDGYEDTIRTAISMGGDADTMACISGAIAGAYYGIPYELKQQAQKFLPDEFKSILTKFEDVL